MAQRCGPGSSNSPNPAGAAPHGRRRSSNALPATSTRPPTGQPASIRTAFLSCVPNYNTWCRPAAAGANLTRRGRADLAARLHVVRRGPCQPTAAAPTPVVLCAAPAWRPVSARTNTCHDLFHPLSRCQRGEPLLGPDAGTHNGPLPLHVAFRSPLLFSTRCTSRGRERAYYVAMELQRDQARPESHLSVSIRHDSR